MWFHPLYMGAGITTEPTIGASSAGFPAFAMAVLCSGN